MQENEARTKNSIKKSPAKIFDLFWSFFKIGLFTIGGGMAMIPILQRIAVDEKKWIDEKEMLDCIAISQAIPGVIAVNMATYIGKRRQGFIGSVAATLGVVLPSFIIISLIVTFLERYTDNEYVQGAFRGIKAALCGMIAFTCIKLGKESLKDGLGWALAAGTFLLIVFFQLSAIWTIVAGAALGIIVTLVERRKKT